MKTVLIVDSDLRFAFWLGQALDRAGYDALPAASAESATTLVAQLGAVIDLVVIGATMPGADLLLAQLRRSQPGLTVMAVADESESNRIAISGVDITEYKPASIDEDVCQEWVSTVQAVLSGNSGSRWDIGIIPQ